ncbi:MAG: ATPase, T2SS/T4P/T4SS family [Candidatus Hadarchaeota archaeon]
MGQQEVEVKESGPLRVMHFSPAEGVCSLSDQKCRGRVIEALKTAGEVDQVVMVAPMTKVYCSPELSRLARSIAAAQQLALDKTLYGGDEKKCKKCVDERMSLLLKSIEQVTANPHNLKSIGAAAENAKLKGECKACTEKNFVELVESIKDMLTASPAVKKLKEDNYDEIFLARDKPFFIEGVWQQPPAGARIIDSYKLTNDRGEVKIYERKENPVPFYEIVLPEFKLPQKQLEILDAAFRLKLEGAPGHARFAYSDRMLSFAEEWYNVLLHMLKGEEKVSTVEIRRLSELMARWLTYRLLEPFSHDDYITDIYIPAPPEIQPVTVEHERWGKLETGIYWTTPSLLGLGETLASRLGTSFDEVRPQLDAEIPELGMRLFLSRYPAIWARSVEVAVRKRRSKPWTQPLFLSRGTLTPLASSLLGNLLRLGASAFVIGEMGSAKTSQVETYIPEIGQQNRIVAFQDTEELHTEDFVAQGYKLANVRVSDPEHLGKQVNAFLRGGASYWLITEVRAAEAVRAALGAAARQGSQPVVASFHARSKKEMFDLVVHIMGLHEAAFKYVDLVVSTGRFNTKSGAVRRIVEVAEVLKDWKEAPEYTELFVDDRAHDILQPKNFLKGGSGLVKRLNSADLSKLDVMKVARSVDFLSPEKGGSLLIPTLCRRLGIAEDDFLKSILVEARIKSDLLMMARKTGKSSYLELPFVSRAYGVYFSSLKRNAPDYKRVLEDWRAWLKRP